MKQPDLDALVYRHQAMATWFEIHIAGEEEDFAKGAAHEAFLLVDRLEDLLSRYRDGSEVSGISRLQDGESFVAAGEVFDCLALALQYAQESGGAFDPALGLAIDRQRGESKGEPGHRGQLLLDRNRSTIHCQGGPVALDLGAIGKGYALDRMAELLQEWGVSQALLAGGGSSIRTLAEDGKPENILWPVSVGDGPMLLLRNGAVGCSGLAVQGAHIIDPRTQLPAKGPERVWVQAPTAAEADAFSTAFMILSAEEAKSIALRHGKMAVARQKKISGPMEWIVLPKMGQHGAALESNP